MAILTSGCFPGNLVPRLRGVSTHHAKPHGRGVRSPRKFISAVEWLSRELDVWPAVYGVFWEVMAIFLSAEYWKGKLWFIVHLDICSTCNFLCHFQSLLFEKPDVHELLGRSHVVASKSLLLAELHRSPLFFLYFFNFTGLLSLCISIISAEGWKKKALSGVLQIEWCLSLYT